MTDLKDNIIAELEAALLKKSQDIRNLTRDNLNLTEENEQLIASNRQLMIDKIVAQRELEQSHTLPIDSGYDPKITMMLIDKMFPNLKK